MGRLTVRLPDSLHQQLEVLAREEGVSLNQYLVYALTRQATLDACQRQEFRDAARQPAALARSANSESQGETEKVGLLHEESLPPPAKA